jgi:hypothetical protein
MGRKFQYRSDTCSKKKNYRHYTPLWVAMARTIKVHVIERSDEYTLIGKAITDF